MDPGSQKLNGLYTCYICFNLLNDATALKKCQHIFCGKCISDKVTQHGWKCCPVCYTNIGPDPDYLINLRPNDALLMSMKTNNLFHDEQKDVKTKSESHHEEEETESEDEETDSEDDETDYEDMETDSEDEESDSEDEETDSEDIMETDDF